MVSIQSQLQNNVQIIRVNGRVDGFSAPQLETELQNAIQAKHYHILVDLSGTEFLSSAGMRALLHARQQLQDKHGNLVLVNPSDYLLESLKLVGLDKLFKIYDSEQAALAAV
jgi:anti-sigma B factor antagonist